MQTLSSLFTEHPKAVDETYFGHMRFALGFATQLTLAALAALTHAIFPFLCERTASDIIKRLHAKTHNRMPEALSEHV